MDDTSSSRAIAFEEDRPKYGVSEFLAITELRPATFWRRLKAGRIAHYRDGRLIRFSERHIRAYFEQIERGTGKAA